MLQSLSDLHRAEEPANRFPNGPPIDRPKNNACGFDTLIRQASIAEKLAQLQLPQAIVRDDIFHSKTGMEVERYAFQRRERLVYHHENEAVLQE